MKNSRDLVLARDSAAGGLSSGAVRPLDLPFITDTLFTHK